MRLERACRAWRVERHRSCGTFGEFAARARASQVREFPPVHGDLALFATPRARALVLVATTLLVFVRLGATDLWPPDEPRYALVAEELRSMENGPKDLVLLHLHGAPYTQKPPLFYWLAATAAMPASADGRRAANSVTRPSGAPAAAASQ